MIESSVPGEPVATRALKASCLRGHEFSAENTGRTRDGRRFCRACDRARKDKHLKSHPKATHEVACPTCRRVRRVGHAQFVRLRRWPHECISCSRKSVRKGLAFQAAECAKCHGRYIPLSGNSKFCSGCSRGRRAEDIMRPCPVCGTRFVGYRNKKACSGSCRRRLNMNASYFGGLMFGAEGWQAKTCLLCERHVPKKFHVHHVFGHPGHSALVVLCAGCHDTVSTLAHRDTFGDRQFARLRWYALAQRLGHPPNGEDRP